MLLIRIYLGPFARNIGPVVGEILHCVAAVVRDDLDYLEYCPYKMQADRLRQTNAIDRGSRRLEWFSPDDASGGEALLQGQ